MKRQPLIATFALFAVLATVVGCGDDDGAPPSFADGIDAVTRQMLQNGEPAVTTGQTLELTRVIVPAGEVIAAHTHPGLQLAVIAEGTLTYTVIRGEVIVTYDAGSANERRETVSGRTVELRRGTSILEPAGMAHMAENKGDDAVVIYTSALFPTGAPGSSPAQ